MRLNGCQTTAPYNPITMFESRDEHSEFIFHRCPLPRPLLGPCEALSCLNSSSWPRDVFYVYSARILQILYYACKTNMQIASVQIIMYTPLLYSIRYNKYILYKIAHSQVEIPSNHGPARDIRRICFAAVQSRL